MDKVSKIVGLKKLREGLAAMREVEEDIDYPVDGIVIKLDHMEDRKVLGQVSKSSVSWAIAWKPNTYSGESTIKKLDVQVGKTGMLTPVAYFEPIHLAGADIQKCSLHNWDIVEELDVRNGDTVVIERAGQVIPYLVSVKKDARGRRRPRKFKPPTECPDCGCKELRRENAFLYCTNNTGCPGQLASLIESAADRTRMDIDGLGPVAIKTLVDNESIIDLADLWALEELQTDSGALPGMTPGKSRKLLEALEKAKERPSWRLLASLGIRHVGRTNSEVICKAVREWAIEAGYAELDVFDYLASERATWPDKLRAITGMGPELVDSLVTWVTSVRNRALVHDLRVNGVNMGARDPVEEPTETAATALTGKSICVTGTFSERSRDDLHGLIATAGGKAVKSVSKKTDYLLAGEKAGSKLAKAQQLGIQVLTEEEFDNLCAAASAG
jgi:DNA ligase (NAD+)